MLAALQTAVEHGFTWELRYIWPINTCILELFEVTGRPSKHGLFMCRHFGYQINVAYVFTIFAGLRN